MSRSYRRTPKRSYYSSQTEKACKIFWHQKMRAALRQCMHRVRIGDADGSVLPYEREVFSDFDFGRAGRYWFDPKDEPHRMRK